MDDEIGHVDILVEVRIFSNKEALATRNFQGIAKHPQYQPRNKYHDIALLKLAAEVTFSHSVWPACLTRNSTFHVGKNLKIAGFGRTDVNNSNTSSIQFEI